MSAKKTMPAEGAGVPPKAVAKTNAGPNTRLSLFLQSALPDFLLVLVISTALVFTVSYGFNSAAAYRGNVALVAVLVLPLIVALFAGSWSKKALIPSAVAVIAVAVAYIGISIAIIPSGLDLLVFDTGIGLWTLNDVAGSYVIFAFILIVVPILAYLLSRRGALLAILVVLGLLACGTIQFLYRDFMTDAGGLWAFLFALLGMAMMFTYQSYRQSIYQAKRVRKVAFFGAFGFSALISAVFVAIGLVVFYVVIASLGLTTPEIKPFQEFWAQPEIALSGTTQDVERPDDENTSDQSNEKTDSNKEEEQGNDSDISEEEQGEVEGNPLAGLSQLLSAFDVRNWNQTYNSISYLIPDWLKFILPVLLVVLFVAFTVFWRCRRTLRLKRLERRPYPYRVWYLYEFLLKRYRRLKISYPAYLTPLEFALGSERVMLPFAEGTGGVDFIDVTTTYQDVCYGGVAVGAEEYDGIVAYYKAFFKNARKHVGGLKWLWKFWRI